MKKLTKKQINDVRSSLDKLSDMLSKQIDGKTTYLIDIKRVGGVLGYEYMHINICISDPNKKEKIYDSDNAFWKDYYTSDNHDHDLEEIDKRIAEAIEFVNQHYPDEHA